MRMSIVEFRNQLADPINRVMYQGERVVLERRGKDVAALVSIEDLQTLEALEDVADLKAAREARKEKRTIPWEKVKSELGLRGYSRQGSATRMKKRKAKA